MNNLILSYSFMQNAVLVSVFATVICAVAGTLVVVNRNVYITGGVAHASYGGIGLALWAGFSPMAGAMGVAVVTGLILGIVRQKDNSKTDALVSGLWAAGMAAGILLSDLTPGYSVDFLSYLFGNILLVTRQDIVITAGFAVILTVLAIKYYRTLLACSADMDYAATLGIPVQKVSLILLVLLCASVIVLMKVAGLILVMALLSIPASIASNFTRQLSSMMVISGIIAGVALLGGLALATWANLTPSAVVVALLAVLYLINIMIKKQTA